MKKLSKINENIFDGIGRRSKGGVVRKEDEPEFAVDLGLPSGTLWCDRYVGATSPGDWGHFYAWGETKQKDDYYYDNYKFGEIKIAPYESLLRKYNKRDGKTILDLEDDVAHVVLGGKWHMPTKKQIKELIDNTTSEEGELDEEKGVFLKSKINGKKLFFSYAGLNCDGLDFGEEKGAYFWSSSLDSYNSKAHIFYYEPDGLMFDSDTYYSSIYYDDCAYRHFGLCVRGVLDKK